MTLIFIILFSGVIGSFLNVCIYRIPKGESLAFPGSHCTKCDKRLTPLELVPVLSYLFLRGKCRHCGQKISLRYPLIELVAIGSVVILYFRLGIGASFISCAILSMLLIVISVIDIDTMMIYDRVLVVGLIACVLIFVGTMQFDMWQSLLGLLVGGGSFFVLALATKGAMGGGDIKLMALLGLWLGFDKIVYILPLSFVVAFVILLPQIIRRTKKGKDAVPFGTYISIAAYITMAFFEPLTTLAWW